MQRRLATSVAGILSGAAIVALFLRQPAPQPPLAVRGLALLAERARTLGDEEIDGATCEQDGLDRGLVLPSGEPTALGCDEARQIVHQAQISLAAAAAPIDAAKFADATSDWLDPHGLWSVAPDAPVGSALKHMGARLLTDLEANPGAGPCAAALEIGAELTRWSAELRRVFDEGAKEGSVNASGQVPPDSFSLASSGPFEDGPITHGALELARALGRHTGALSQAYGEPLAPYVDAARRRAAPPLDAEGWSRVVIAAALRAYIPQLDAHGAWAPLDEEISIYDLALEANPPERLWAEMTRTAVGVRIDRGAMAPLMAGDVVLKVQSVPLAGVSVEQAEQLSVIPDAQSGTSVKVVVLRQQEDKPIELSVRAQPVSAAAPSPPDASSELAMELVRYGDGRAAVLHVSDVPDDLGSRLDNALERARAARDLRGLVLDLRANGGGSTDGAIEALGHFIPGVSLFPMRRRDGEIEIERSSDVPLEKQYAGPLAVLVDGDSASAAEMIAGALASYRRATVIGDRTYGKGCAQEYLDDDAHAGVLRLTTLLFALPDGSPVQKVGILPQVHLSLPSTTEREARLSHALDPWRGPDVRDMGRIHEVPWPQHVGRIGPCEDMTICRALRSLGAAPAAAR